MTYKRIAYREKNYTSRSSFVWTLFNGFEYCHLKLIVQFATIKWFLVY